MTLPFAACLLKQLDTGGGANAFYRGSYRCHPCTIQRQASRRAAQYWGCAGCEQRAKPQDECCAVQARRMLREADENGDGLVSRQEFHDLFTRSTAPDVLQGYDARWTAPEASNGAVAA